MSPATADFFALIGLALVIVGLVGLFITVITAPMNEDDYE